VVVGGAASSRAIVDTNYIVEILVDDPATAIHGTLLGGYVYVAENGQLRVIHDRSGRLGWILDGSSPRRAGDPKMAF
jgi:hypothetical protein